MALASKITSNQWAGFSRVGSGRAVPRLIGLSLQKETGAGTSHFWLTAPGPIVVFSLTPGDLEGVVEEFAEKKPVYLKEYEWAPTDDDSFTQADAVALRDEFAADFLKACEHARSIVLDKESHLWELYRYGEWGKPQADIPRDFAALNQRYKKIISRPKTLTINFGAIQTMKAEWASATKKTDGLKPWGFSELSSLAHVTLAHECAEGGNFTTTVHKVRGPGRKDVLEANPFTNLDVPTLGMMLYPDTDMKDWS